MERLNLDKFKILAAAVTLAMFAGTACAETELYGQINRTITHFDDSRDQGTLFSDNSFAPSMLGVKSMAHVNKCVTVGGVLEAQMGPNRARFVSQLRQTEAGSNIMFVNKADVWASAGVWGKLSVGYGDPASMGITRMSYARTGDTVSSSRVENLAGGMHFHTQGNTSRVVATNPTVAVLFNSIDGVGSFDLSGKFNQKNRVRWDSDKWNGLSLAVSHGSVQERVLSTTDFTDVDPITRSYTDAALRYEGSFDDFMVSAGLGMGYYTRDSLATEDNVTTTGANRGQKLWAGSVAAEHKPTGFNAAFSYGNKRKMIPALNNQKSWFAQVGKHFSWMHYGKTNLAIDFFKGTNVLTNVDNSKSFGFGVVQDLDKANSSVYATVRNYKYNTNTTTKYDTIKVAAVGFMFKFGAML